MGEINSAALDRYITGNWGEDAYQPSLIEKLEEEFKNQDVVLQGYLAERFVELSDGYDKEDINEAIDYLNKRFGVTKKYLRDMLKDMKWGDLDGKSIKGKYRNGSKNRYGGFDFAGNM